MNMYRFGENFITCERENNDANRNPVYTVNVYRHYNEESKRFEGVYMQNVNAYVNKTHNKNNSLRIKSYNIIDELKAISQEVQGLVDKGIIESFAR